ncbi:MAG: hypothetical protein PHH28_08975 [Desulfuromonadaceae bacterium]|nr:hypothetical protein [Desulfuromonadaceae bacterium]
MVVRSDETPSVDRSGEPVETKLRRIAEKARKEPGFKFSSLYHLMNEELLRECGAAYHQVRKRSVHARPELETLQEQDNCQCCQNLDE